MRGITHPLFRVALAAGCALWFCAQTWAAAQEAAPAAAVPAKGNVTAAAAVKPGKIDAAVARLDKAISKKAVSDAMEALAELEKLAPADIRVFDLREKVATLFIADLEDAVSRKSVHDSAAILDDMEKVSPDDDRIPVMREKIVAFLVSDLEQAISKEHAYTARRLVADLETFVPDDTRLPDWREKVATLPEPSDTLALDVGGGVKMEFVLIKPGTFNMGSETGGSDERPVGKAVIAKPFYLGKFEVTQEQWKAVMGLDPLGLLATGVVNRMKETAGADAAALPIAKIQEAVAAQWKIVMGANPSSVPPIALLSTAAKEVWTTEGGSDPKSIPTETLAKALVRQWEKIGTADPLESMAKGVVEQVKAEMDASPGGASIQTIEEAVAAQWKVVMGPDPLETVAKEAVKKMKTDMGVDTRTALIDKAARAIDAQLRAAMSMNPKSAQLRTITEKAVTDQWKAVLGVEEMDSDAVDEMARIIADQWAAERQAERKAVSVAAISKLISEQMKSAMNAYPESFPVDATAKLVAEKWRTLPGADPLALLAEAVAEDWKAAAANAKSLTVEDRVKSVAERWKNVMHSESVKTSADAVAKTWEETRHVAAQKANGDSLPVVNVNWSDCMTFVARLAIVCPGRTFRLPTEAEWEYASRAGATTDYSFGDDPKTLGEYAWYDANSEGALHPVGRKKPNAWGLHDMYGNVQEWCHNRYQGYPFKEGDGGKTAHTDPHPLRGGFWQSPAEDVRSASRLGYAASNRYFTFGCRVALSSE